MEALVKENHLLKQQLQNCFSKVAKTQKVNKPKYDINQYNNFISMFINIFFLIRFDNWFNISLRKKSQIFIERMKNSNKHVNDVKN